MHATQVLADVARWGVVAIDNKPVVTWMASGKWTFKLDGREVTVSTQRRGPTTWRVKVESPQPLDAVIRLRVPRWCRELSIDGKGQAGSGGWAEVPCRGGETVSLDVTFPKEIRRAGVYADEVKAGEPVRLFLGGDLMCLPDALVEKGLLAVGSRADHPDRLGQGRRQHRAGHRRVGRRVEEMPHAAGADVVGVRSAGACTCSTSSRRTPAEFARWASLSSRTACRLRLLLACDGQSEFYFNGELLARQSAVGEGLHIPDPREGGQERVGHSRSQRKIGRDDDRHDPHCRRHRVGALRQAVRRSCATTRR